MNTIYELVDYWFGNPDTWFGCDSNTDDKIKNKYGYLLGMELNPNDDIKYNLGLILLWDQISRHVYRNDKSQIIPFHNLSLKLAMEIINRNDDLVLNSHQRCFILMPLRHTFEIYYMEIVITKIKQYIKDEPFDNYKRFYRATLLSYSKLITNSLTSEPINNTITESDIVNILDKNSGSCIYSTNNDITKTNIYKSFDILLSKNKPEGIVISISGGVDSMVSSYVLSHISKKYNIKIIGAMVNYNNRSECSIETQLVTRWLKSLGIDLYVRHIKYLRRKNEDDPIDRNFYEELTKEFRFDLYRIFGYPVVLGHNKDDSIENIFTNIRKGRNYDNLLGMVPLSTINNITIYRPLLNTMKKEIYEFAKQYGIPYLTDSTPKWSDRGRMRDILIPFVNEFDPALISGLISLSGSITELSRSEVILLNQVKSRIIFGSTTAIVDITEDEKDLGYSFWKSIIKHVTEHFKIKMCSNKSIQSLLKLFENNNKQINLSKQLKLEVHKNKISFVLSI